MISCIITNIREKKEGFNEEKQKKNNKDDGMGMLC